MENRIKLVAQLIKSLINFKKNYTQWPNQKKENPEFSSPLQ
jgi:hypothetical protein